MITNEIARVQARKVLPGHRVAIDGQLVTVTTHPRRVAQHRVLITYADANGYQDSVRFFDDQYLARQVQIHH